MADMQMMTPEESGSMEQEAGGMTYKVCIVLNEDGTYTVYQEDNDADADNAAGAQDMGAGAAAMGEEDMSGGAGGGQTVQSVDEALEIARGMLEQEGSEDSGDMGSGDEPLGPDQAKAAWDQLAAKKDKQRLMMK